MIHPGAPVIPTWSRRAVLLACLQLASGGSALSAQGRQRVPDWEVTQPRGRTREIEFTTQEGTWMSVDLSPDGRWAVFDLLAQIYRVPIEGGEAECLTQNSGIALNYHPRFSPDGREIAFVSDRNGQDNLWVMHADGSDPRTVVTDYNSHVLEPIWAPDGQSLIVRRQQVEWPDSPERTSIWRYPRGGGPGDELVRPNEVISWPWVARGPSSPSLSKDGRYLYYQIFTGSGPRKSASIDVLAGSFQILRLDLTTRATTAITVSGEGGFAPSVSPDGRWLAFAQRVPDGILIYKGHRLTSRTALWLRDLRTGAERVVMDPIEVDAAEEALKSYLVLPRYAWAADGQSIVIGQGGKLRRLWVETGRVETIPFTARVHRTLSEMARASLPVSDAPFQAKLTRWHAAAPDGRRLVFQAVGRLWVLDLPGGKPRRLTPTSFQPLEYTPAWSPDGQWIAFTTVDREGLRHLWKVSAAGGEPARLSQESASYLNPAWSADGRSIVLARGGGVTARGRDLADEAWYELVRVPSTGGPMEPLVTVDARAQTAGFLVRPITGTGSDGRIFYTEVAAGKTVLRSIGPDGGDRRDHLRFRYASDIVPSPDRTWAAVEENGDVYLAPFPTNSGGPEAPLVDLQDPASRSKRLSRSGGYSPRWRDARTLEFGHADRYMVHHLDTGRTDTLTIHLSIPRAIPAGTIALTNARIITADSAHSVIDRGSVVVRNGRIACVGPCRTEGADRVMDLSGKTIIPGLIDMHSHPRAPALGIVPPQSHEYAVFLAYGVTTSREAFGLPQHNFAVAELIEAGLVTGSRAYNVGGGIIPVPYGSSIGAATPGVGPFYEVPTYQAAEEHIRRIMSWGAVALKNYYQPARDRRQVLVEAARRNGLTATAENDDLDYVLGFVMDGNAGFEHSIRNLPLYGDVIQFLGKARIVYSSTLIAGTGSQRGKDYWVQELDTWRDPKERLWRPWLEFIPSQRRRPLRPATDYRHPLYAQGVADVIAAGGYGSIGSHGEIGGLGAQLEVWMNASAMSPLQALEVASRHGAYFLGAERDLGSLEVGKVADLIVLNANPLEDIRNTLDMFLVMKGGRLYDDDTLDEVWPERKPYGPRPWVNAAMLRTDERPVDYYDRK